MYYDSKRKKYQESFGIQIKVGDLSEYDICDKVKIQGTANSRYGGEFKRSDKYSQGKPVFINNHGTYLSSWDLGWSIGPEVCKGVFFSKSERGFCPTKAFYWHWLSPTTYPMNIIITKLTSKESLESTSTTTVTDLMINDVVEMKIDADASQEPYLVIVGDGDGI